MSSATQNILLRRAGRVFARPGPNRLDPHYLEALEIELAELGYALSTRLRDRLGTLDLVELTRLRSTLLGVLGEKTGANRKHEPLFRRFPDGIPEDTYQLWCRKVLSHFFQASDQPCLFCGATATTHVLNPCRHVVCSHCFDGGNYSACPVCEQPVDRASPFFLASPELGLPNERVKLKRLDLGGEPHDEAKALFLGFCERKQAMSAQDKEDFLGIVKEYGVHILALLPATLPVRENVALLFGALLQVGDAGVVLESARPYLRSATDVLRLIAAYSGADPALQGQLVYRLRNIEDLRAFPKYRQWFANGGSWATHSSTIRLPRVISRFKVARLPRALRRALLGFMEGFKADSLTEDMLRHRSYWVWLGEFLHPFEYRARFPQVARAFEIVRKKAPDGTPAPVFRSYYAQMEAAIRASDAAGMTRLLATRPGEFARRFDHLLRVAAGDRGEAERVRAVFNELVRDVSTPVLVTLRAHLGTRHQPVKQRVYWPKGQVAKGVFGPDRRTPLTTYTLGDAIPTIQAELLRRFSGKPKFERFIIDDALKRIIVPFNERTASKSAIQLPRGSTVDVELGKTMRLFLHWCEPATAGRTTDLDLSVAFYDAQWDCVGVCSYYQLAFKNRDGETVARSAGDLRAAPFPDGATEFVDFDREAALACGIRYAVAVINNYAGMPFEQLERAYAGLMLRDDVHGKHFDPRTVALKFALQGSNGIFLPLVVDLADSRLHWLDVHSKGGFAFNNVASSDASITTICPRLIDYFASGARASMYDLALLHAAARSDQALLRKDGATTLVRRRSGESDAAFLERLQKAEGEPAVAMLPESPSPVFALLLKGDIDLPDGGQAFVVMPESVAGNVSASDLFS